MNFKKIDTYAKVCEVEGVDPIQSLPFPNPKNASEISDNGHSKVQRIVRVITGGSTENKYYYPWWMKVSKTLAGGGSGVGLSFLGCVDDYSFTFVGVPLQYCSREQVNHIGEYFVAEYEEMLLPQQ